MEEIKQKTTKTRGGARPGAGRKKINHGKYYGFNSTQTVEKVLESISTSKTDFINAAIEHYAKERDQRILHQQYM